MCLHVQIRLNLSLRAVRWSLLVTREVEVGELLLGNAVGRVGGADGEHGGEPVGALRPPHFAERV